jgi:hypothetical protein
MAPAACVRAGRPIPAMDDRHWRPRGQLLVAALFYILSEQDDATSRSANAGKNWYLNVFSWL